MVENPENTVDFTQEDLNGFFYTNDRHIKRMDDELVVAKLAERYPDFLERENENLCRLAFYAIATDTKFINEVTKFLGMTAVELFAVVYRTHTFLFNSCFIAKIHKIVKSRSYGRIQRPSPKHGKSPKPKCGKDTRRKVSSCEAV